MAGVGGNAYLLTWTSPSLLYLPSPPLCLILPPSGNPFEGWVSLVRGRFGAVDMEDEAKALSEFQTPIVFDCDCNFDCSTFYKPPKIVKVITYILYIHENVSRDLNP
jgi:hypothetical protein